MTVKNILQPNTQARVKRPKRSHVLIFLRISIDLGLTLNKSLFPSRSLGRLYVIASSSSAFNWPSSKLDTSGFLSSGCKPNDTSYLGKLWHEPKHPSTLFRNTDPTMVCKETNRGHKIWNTKINFTIVILYKNTLWVSYRTHPTLIMTMSKVGGLYERYMEEDIVHFSLQLSIKKAKPTFLLQRYLALQIIIISFHFISFLWRTHYFSRDSAEH